MLISLILCFSFVLLCGAEWFAGLIHPYDNVLYTEPSQYPPVAFSALDYEDFFASSQTKLSKMIQVLHRDSLYNAGLRAGNVIKGIRVRIVFLPVEAFLDELRISYGWITTAQIHNVCTEPRLGAGTFAPATAQSTTIFGPFLNAYINGNNSLWPISFQTPITAWDGSSSLALQFTHDTTRHAAMPCGAAYCGLQLVTPVAGQNGTDLGFFGRTQSCSYGDWPYMRDANASCPHEHLRGKPMPCLAMRFVFNVSLSIECENEPCTVSGSSTTVEPLASPASSGAQSPAADDAGNNGGGRNPRRTDLDNEGDEERSAQQAQSLLLVGMLVLIGALIACTALGIAWYARRRRQQRPRLPPPRVRSSVRETSGDGGGGNSARQGSARVYASSNALRLSDNDRARYGAIGGSGGNSGGGGSGSTHYAKPRSRSRSMSRGSAAAVDSYDRVSVSIRSNSGNAALDFNGAVGEGGGARGGSRRSRRALAQTPKASSSIYDSVAAPRGTSAVYDKVSDYSDLQLMRGSKSANNDVAAAPPRYSRVGLPAAAANGAKSSRSDGSGGTIVIPMSRKATEYEAANVKLDY